MKIKTEINRQRRKYKFINLVILLVISALLLISEPFWEAPLFDASIDFEIELQNKSNNNFLKFMQLITYAGTVRLFLPIIVLVFNFVNVYKSVIVSLMYVFPHYLTGLLKMLYQGQRPYWVNPRITIIDCEMGYGNPSGHALVSTAFYLTLWHIIFENGKLKNRTKMKFTVLVAFLVFIFFICISRLYVGAHSINQILFGFVIGFLIFFATFHVLALNVNDGQEFMKIISFPSKYFYTIFLVLSIFPLIWFYSVDFKRNAEWDSNVVKSNSKCAHVARNRKYEYESFLSYPVLLSSVFIFIGTKLDIDITFQGNYNNWSRCNFNQDLGEDESLISTLSMSKDTQWNHTTSVISLLRIVVWFFINVLPMVIFQLFSYDSNLYVVAIFKVGLPNALLCFNSYFTTKFACKKLRLVNQYVHTFFNDQRL